MDKKIIRQQSERNLVTKELEEEIIKLQSYDQTILSILWNVENKEILDYWAWPWVLALLLKKLWANSKVYDISEEMCLLSEQKIWKNNVYKHVSEIPLNFFDSIICNLVLCIVEDDEVERIVHNMFNELRVTWRAYIWFCNPLIYNVPESNLDIRDQTNHTYEQNHTYTKTKKEGWYNIIETHRPIEWYKRVFEKTWFQIMQTNFTPEYLLHWIKIKDFVIFELIKPLS